MEVGAAPAYRFEYQATADFAAKLGELVTAELEAANQIANLMKRVLRNPYDPSLVRRCWWVSDDNRRFSDRVGQYFLWWKVACRKPLSVVDTDWEITFSKITAASG